MSCHSRGSAAARIWRPTPHLLLLITSIAWVIQCALASKGYHQRSTDASSKAADAAAGPTDADIKAAADAALADVGAADDEESKESEEQPTSPVASQPSTSAPTAASMKKNSASDRGFEIPTLLPPGHTSVQEEEDNLQRSPVVLFSRAVNDWLHDGSSPQLYIGFGAIVAGVFMCGCGSMFWQYIFSTVVALATALFVSYQDETLKLAPGSIGNAVLILQVAVIMGLATYFGFEGSQLLLGSVVGLLAAYFTDPLAATWEKELHWISFAWFCAGAACGGVLFTTVRQSSLATLAPLIGGFLLISGAGTVITWLCGSLLLSKDTTWIDAAAALLGHTGGAGMVGQSLLALLCIPVFHATGSAGKSVAPMAVGLGIGALGTSSGFGCKIFNKCPPWLLPAENWCWPLLGGLAWMGTAVGGAAWQLTQLQQPNTSPRSERKKGKRTEGKSNSQREGAAKEETQTLLTQPQLHLPPEISSSSSTYGGGYSTGRAHLYS